MWSADVVKPNFSTAVEAAGNMVDDKENTKTEMF